MGIIKELTPELANMIAAGEVVERPASVIKELVENSIDAKATSIEIKVKNAGKTFISVLDNGTGMSKEDALMAFKRHATSKVSDVNDLFRIGSLGFRGEALPSISSVSKLTLETSMGEVGTRVIVEDGEFKVVEPCSAKKGTYICVEDLFYNTPARLKHLKSDYTELAVINETILKLALSYPHISFSLFNEDRLSYTTSGNGNLLENIALLYGTSVGKNMLRVEGENFDFRISGYISSIKESKPNRYSIITILNGRAVRMPNVMTSIIESYRTYLPSDRFPIVVLNIESELSLVDVNVHPSKNEVRLSKEDQLKELVSSCILDTLKKSFLVPEVSVVNKPKEIVSQGYLHINYPSVRKEETLELKEIPVEYNKQVDKLSELELTSQFTSDNVNKEIETTKNIIKTENKPYQKHIRIIGQIHGTYIVGEDEEGMYLIDQHAAMERINYEKFSKLILENHDSIDLLVPIVLEYDASSSIQINKFLPILADLGLCLEPFGINTFRINSVPIWAKESDIKVYAVNMIEQILSTNKIDLNILRKHAISTLACKASLKANKVLSLYEMEVLVQRLFDECDNPFTCAHGRPTIVKITAYELEKMFKRV